MNEPKLLLFKTSQNGLFECATWKFARQHFGSWTYPPDVEQGGTTVAWVSGWNHFFSWKTISHAPDPSTCSVRIHRRTMMMMSSAHKSFHTRSLLNCISSCRLNWTALLKEPIVDFGVIPEDDSLLNHSSSHSGEFALWFSVIWKSYDGKMLFINRMISVFFPRCVRRDNMLNDQGAKAWNTSALAFLWISKGINTLSASHLLLQPKPKVSFAGKDSHRSRGAKPKADRAHDLQISHLRHHWSSQKWASLRDYKNKRMLIYVVVVGDFK